jgi:predicted amidophosphoribosyltransferase
MKTEKSTCSKHEWDTGQTFCIKCGQKVRVIESCDVIGYSMMSDGSIQPQLRNVKYKEDVRNT